MNHIYKIGDEVITTRGNVGTVVEVVEGTGFIEISPEFEGYNMTNGIPFSNGDKTFYNFSKEGFEDKILTQGEDFDFKNNDRYVVQFQKNQRQFHPASLRHFDQPFTVNTIQVANGVETHIECKYHNQLPDGPIISTEIKTPSYEWKD